MPFFVLVCLVFSFERFSDFFINLLLLLFILFYIFQSQCWAPGVYLSLRHSQQHSVLVVGLFVSLSDFIIAFPLLSCCCKEHSRSLSYGEFSQDVVGGLKFYQWALWPPPLPPSSTSSIPTTSRRSTTTPTTVWRSPSTAAPTSTTASSAPRAQVPCSAPARCHVFVMMRLVHWSPCRFPERGPRLGWLLEPWRWYFR